MGLPDYIEERLGRYERAGEELIRKTIDIFANDNFAELLSKETHMKLLQELGTMSKRRKQCFRSAIIAPVT